MTDETVLKLGDLVIPVGSGRGISQSIKPIDNGDLRRTVNGKLIDMTREQNRKFESQITATDMATPTFAGVWKGSEIEVECIAKLRQYASPASAVMTLIRTPVPGSIFGFTATGEKLQPESVDDLEITFASPVVFVAYRPILLMMVIATSWDDDEYAAEEAWTIDLEEV